MIINSNRAIVFYFINDFHPVSNSTALKFSSKKLNKRVPGLPVRDNIYSSIYHIIYSTKGRRRTLKPDVRAGLFPYIGGIALNAGGSAVSVGGVEDHVHMLVKIDPNVGV